jgi:hypothetical protein
MTARTANKVLRIWLARRKLHVTFDVSFALTMFDPLFFDARHTLLMDNEAPPSTRCQHAHIAPKFRCLRQTTSKTFIYRTLAVPSSPCHQGVPIVNMPNEIPDSQIREFLATNTRPVVPTDSADIECPICQIPYASPPQTSVHPDLPSGEEEYAVQIQNKAECRHIFGRRCLEDHIRSGKPWSHKCPFCRTGWFPAPNNTGEDAREEVDWERVYTILADAERARPVPIQVGRSLESLRNAREELERLFALLDARDAEQATPDAEQVTQDAEQATQNVKQARQELGRVASSLERLRDAMDQESRII